MAVDLTNLTTTTTSSVLRPTPMTGWPVLTLWTIMIFLSVVTIVGNMLVIWAYRLDGPLRKSMGNRFIISLAVSDCIIGFEGYPFFTVFVANGETWPLGGPVCLIWLFLDYSLCLVSILTVLLITCDRFLSVCHTARYIQWQTPGRMNLVIAISWIVPALFFGVMIFGWESITGESVPFEKCYAPFLQNEWVNMIMYFTYYWSTLIAMFVLYTGIHKKSRELQTRACARQKRTLGLLMGQRLGAQVGVKLLLHTIDNDQQKRRSVSSIVPPTSPFFDEKEYDRDKSPKASFDLLAGGTHTTNAEVTQSFLDVTPVKGNHVQSQSNGTAQDDVTMSVSDRPQVVSFEGVLDDTKGTIDRLQCDPDETERLISIDGDDTSLRTGDNSPQSVSVSFDSVSLTSGFRDQSFRSVLNLEDGTNWPLTYTVRKSQRRRNRRTSLRRSLQTKRVMHHAAVQAQCNSNIGVHSPIRPLITHSKSFQPTLNRQETLESISSDEEYTDQPCNSSLIHYQSISLRSPTYRSCHEHLLSTGSPCSYRRSPTSLQTSACITARLAESEQSVDVASSICTPTFEITSEQPLIHNHVVFTKPPPSSPKPPPLPPQTKPEYESNDTTVTKTHATNDSNEVNKLVPKEVRKGIRHSVMHIVRHARHRPSWDQTSTDDDDSDAEAKPKGHGEAIVNIPADGSTAAGGVMQALFKPINMLRRIRKTKAERRAHKAFRTITFIVGFFAALWSPYFIVATIYGFCVECVHPVVFIVCYYLCYVNSAGNPFMYALANQQFKAAFTRIFKGQWHRT